MGKRKGRGGGGDSGSDAFELWVADYHVAQLEDRLDRRRAALASLKHEREQTEAQIEALRDQELEIVARMPEPYRSDYLKTLAAWESWRHDEGRRESLEDQYRMFSTFLRQTRCAPFLPQEGESEGPR